MSEKRRGVAWKHELQIQARVFFFCKTTTPFLERSPWADLAHHLVFTAERSIIGAIFDCGSIIAPEQVPVCASDCVLCWKTKESDRESEDGPSGSRRL